MCSTIVGHVAARLLLWLLILVAAAVLSGELTANLSWNDVWVHHCTVRMARRQVTPNMPELLEIGSRCTLSNLGPKRCVTSGTTLSGDPIPALRCRWQREKRLC